MKKVLLIILGLVGLALLTLGIFVFNRYQKNPLQVVPFPYSFKESPQEVKLVAPILIIGDRMGSHMANFKAELISTISQNLSNSIKVQSLAQEHWPIHRTIEELRALNQWPQILIYQGASEEMWENKFELSEIKKIQKNFKIYQDDRIQTLLVLYPSLSRIIYGPIARTELAKTPLAAKTMEHEEYLKRLDTEVLLFEQHIIQLINMSKNKNSLLILTTTPINLDIPPKKNCSFTSTLELEKDLLEIENLMKNSDYKTAFNKSSKLITQYQGHASLLYTHGKILQNLGEIDEARETLKMASAYDCISWRTTEVQNAMIRRLAKTHQVILFDFAKLVEADWPENTTFVDEIFAQNIYYEYGMKQLGLVIKGILKL